MDDGLSVATEDVSAVLGAGNDSGDTVVNANPYDITNDEVRHKISSRIDKKLEIDRVSRAAFERSWFRNLCFVVGQQQIVYDHGKFRLRRVPAWFPKSQTNKFGEKARDLKSAILQGRVPIRYMPATDDPKDQWMSDIGERVRGVIYAEAKIDDREEELASWFIDTGNAFIQPYYDYDEKHGMAEVPKLGCPECKQTFGAADVDEQGIDEEQPICPECSAQAPGVDEFGAEVPAPQPPLLPSEEMELLPIGALCADFLSAFEIRCDYRIRDYRDWTWYIRQRRYDKKFAEDKWEREGLLASEGKEAGETLAQHYLDVLASITDAFNPAQTLGEKGSSKSPKVTAYELYDLPDEDFPEGLRAVRIGSGEVNVVEAGPLTTAYGAGVRKDQKFLNIIHLCAEKVPGRLWGKTPLDDAVPLQVFRNIVEANIRLTVQRMGNGIWLIPKGSGVENLTGEPGQQVPYNPVTLGGTTIAKPERVPAELNNLGALLELLKFIDDQIERVTGTYFLQGGDAPSGVTAACVDAETEAMTRRGWKSYNELLPSDELYALNQATGKGEWTKLKQIHLHPDYDGEIWDFDGRDISFSVTPNHKWPNTQRYKAKLKDNSLGKVEMQDVKKHHKLPAQIVLDKKKGIENPYFAELVGWIVTEGGYTPPSKKRRTKHWEVRIYQSMQANAWKCAKIQKCLDKCGIKYRIYDRPNGMRIFLFNGEQGDAFVNQFPDKRPGYDFINSLSRRQIVKMLKAMVLGDGHKKKSKYISPLGNDLKPQRHTTYMSCDEELAQQFQYAAVLAGFPTALKQYDNGQKTHCNERYTSTESWVSLKKMKHLQWLNILPDIKRSQKKQLVWCPETVLGTWVARRKGKAYVTCNSALALL